MRTTDSAMQRLQVGLIGLIVVLVFVSVASMLSDSANGPPVATANGGAKAVNGKVVNDEPPVELGVTPVVSEQPKEPQPKAAPAGQIGPQR